MPNPVAVNDLSPISGSLQTSRVSYGVETAGKNYGQNYNSTNWYSDIPNNGQFYTIISDNYTANYYVSRSNAGGAYVEGGLPAVDEYSAPVFWVTVGTSSLDVITIVNGLPDRIGQVPFNSGSQALNWIASSSNYFAVGPDYYDQIDADQIALYLDSNQIISYPTTMSTWYDISGYNWKATLINGPSFNTTYNTINFDDTNDYGIFPGSNGDILSSASYASRNATWEGIVRFNAGTGTDAIITKWDNSTGENWWFGRYPTDTVHLALITSAGYQGLLSSATINTSTSRFQQIAVTTSGSNYVFYINGVNAGSGTYSGTWSVPDLDTPVALGAQNTSTGGAALFGGDMSKVRLYNKTLSAAEVAQNYYSGPIVTDGLFLAQDAGNLVSYPRTGTTLYDLTSNGFLGALTNGVGFSTEVGGALTFDGVNDYVVTNVSTPNITSKTLEVWVRLNDVSQQGGGAINLQYDGGSIFDAIVYNETGQGWGFGSEGFYRTAWSGVIETSTAQWIHMVATYQNNNFRMYRNGILILTTTSFTTLNYNTDSESLLGLRHNGATHLNASIAVGRIYSRALTQSEVLQNYNASF
jgi:hypothetical protein